MFDVLHSWFWSRNLPSSCRMSRLPWSCAN